MLLRTVALLLSRDVFDNLTCFVLVVLDEFLKCPDKFDFALVFEFVDVHSESQIFVYNAYELVSHLKLGKSPLILLLLINNLPYKPQLIRRLLTKKCIFLLTFPLRVNLFLHLFLVCDFALFFERTEGQTENVQRILILVLVSLFHFVYFLENVVVVSDGVVYVLQFLGGVFGVTAAATVQKVLKMKDLSDL